MLQNVRAIAARVEPISVDNEVLGDVGEMGVVIAGQVARAERREQKHGAEDGETPTEGAALAN
jgi:hypothetical protein